MYLHVHDLRAQERWTVTVTGGASSSFLRDAKFEGRLLVESHRVQHVDFDLNRLCIRALQVCNGLRMLGLDALTMCEILMKSCDEADADVPFHRWWQIATTVKHFKGKFEPEGGYTFGYSRATVPSVMHVYGD